MALMVITLDRKTMKEKSVEIIKSEREPNWAALVDTYIGAFINNKEEIFTNEQISSG